MRIIDSRTIGDTRIMWGRIVASNGATAYVVRVVRNGTTTDANFGARRYAESAFNRITQSARVMV